MLLVGFDDGVEDSARVRVDEDLVHEPSGGFHSLWPATHNSVVAEKVNGNVGNLLAEGDRLLVAEFTALLDEAVLVLVKVLESRVSKCEAATSGGGYKACSCSPGAQVRKMRTAPPTVHNRQPTRSHTQLTGPPCSTEMKRSHSWHPARTPRLVCVSTRAWRPFLRSSINPEMVEARVGVSSRLEAYTYR